MKHAADAILQASQAAYLEGLEPPRDELLVRLEAAAAARGLPISDPEVASFLAITVAAMATRPLSKAPPNWARAWVAASSGETWST